MKKKTVVLGASTNPARYSYAACQLLHQKGENFLPVGIKKGKVFGQEILPLFSKPVIDNVGTITIYMNEVHQRDFHDYILNLSPDRIIFNPGAENIELKKLAEEKGILTEFACTLVLLNTGQY